MLSSLLSPLALDTFLLRIMLLLLLLLFAQKKMMSRRDNMRDEFFIPRQTFFQFNRMMLMASSFTSAGAALTTKQFVSGIREQEDEKEEQNSIGASVRASSLRESTEKARSRRFVLLLFAFLFPAQSLASSSSFDERFSGSFADPNHPGCPREITKNGVLRGYDPVPFEKGKGCRGRKVVTPEDVFQYPGKTMRYWEIQTKLVGKTKDEIYIDFDQKDGSGEKVVAKLNER